MKVGQNSNIFDLGKGELLDEGSTIGKLKDAISKVKGEDEKDSFGIETKLKKSSVGKELSDVAKREAEKTEKDIYQEVFIDEVNAELL